MRIGDSCGWIPVNRVQENIRVDRGNSDGKGLQHPTSSTAV